MYDIYWFVVGELLDCLLDFFELGRLLDVFVKVLDFVVMGCVGKIGDFVNVFNGLFNLGEFSE